MKRKFVTLLPVISIVACLFAGNPAVADSSAGAASASASVRISINIPVRTLLRVSSAGVDSQTNISKAASSASLGCDDTVAEQCDTAFYTLSAL